MALLRLAAWQAILAAVLAAFLLGVAVVDATGPRSCEDANASRDAGLLTDAENGYAAILKEEPTSACAQEGMNDLVARHCTLASDAKAAGDTDAAKEQRAAALKIQPNEPLPDEPDNGCG